MKLSETRLVKLAYRLSVYLGHPLTIVVLLCVAAAGFIWLSFASQASWGGGDAIVHYRMSRYAWKHPWLFLDLWGKPLFTFLSAPFALGGFGWMKIFNVLIALATAWFGFRMLRHLKVPYPVWFIPLLLTAPIYFILIPSPLTEPLFGLMLILIAFLFLKKRYALAAILTSLLPYSRTESIVIFPFVILALGWLRQWRNMPWLLFGTAVVALAGYGISGQWDWIIRNFPYGGYGEMNYAYANGDFWHYPRRLPELFGKTLFWMSLAGISGLLLRLLRKRDRESLLFVLLVFLPAVTLLIFHSWLLWKGPGVALGLDRMMAPLVPLAAVTAVFGMGEIIGRLQKPRYLVPLAGLVLLIFSLADVKTPLKRFPLPLPLGEEERVAVMATNWIKENGWKDAYIYYHHPWIIHLLERDPYAQGRVQEAPPADYGMSARLPDDALICWDSHFSPNEGMMPLDSLLQDTTLIRLAVFPEEMEDWNLSHFQVHLFTQK